MYLKLCFASGSSSLISSVNLVKKEVDFDPTTGYSKDQMCDVFFYFYIHCQYGNEEPHAMCNVQRVTGDEEPTRANQILVRTRIIIQNNRML